MMGPVILIAAVLGVYALAALIVYGRRLWRSGRDDAAGARRGRRRVRPQRKCPQYWF